MKFSQGLLLWLSRYRKIFSAIAIFAFGLASYSALAISENELLGFRHLINNPADQSELGRLRSIGQDRDGNIWFAGIGNLARFDGVELTFFKSNPADPTSLATNSVAALLCDQDGVLWVSSEQALQIYLPERENFLMVASVQEGAESARYISMARSGEDSLWLLGLDEISKVDIHSHQISPMWNTGAPNSPLYHKKLRVIFEDADRRVWVATEKSEIFVFDSNGVLIKQWTHNYRGLPAVMDIAIMQDQNKNIWISGRGAGAARISDNLDKVTTFLADNSPGALPSDDVAGVAQDGRGRIWLAVDHQGLTLFDEPTQQFRVIPHSPYDLLSPATNQPQKIFADRAGDIWVEHNTNGVDYLGGVNFALARYRKAQSQQNSISNNSITAVLQDDAKGIWVGTESGLNFLNSETQQFSRIALADTTILSLAKIPGGAVWAGTQYDGLFQVDRDGKTIQHFNEAQGLDAGGLLCLTASANGDLWIGSKNRGLIKLSKNDVSLRYYARQPSQLNTLSNDAVQSIIEVDSETILVGTAFGLNRFNPITGRFFRIDADSDLFKSHDIRSLLKKKNGTIWVATKSGGITVLDQNLRPVQHLGVSDGLPSESVSGLAEDEFGMVWALTLEGAAYINPTTLEMTILKREQGLSSNYFNHNAVMVDDQGFAYLGSVDGLSVVMRPSLKPQLPRSVALINKLFLLNSEVSANAPNSPLAMAMTATETLTLEYSASLIGFGFSTTNLRGGENLRFRYQLDGVDKTWVTASLDRRATYASLPSGTYIFRVQAGDQNEFWTSSEDRLTLTVLPPPWLSTRAKLVYTIIGFLAMYILWSVLALDLRRRRAEFILRTKTDFLSILSHEIRTPLSGIIGMLVLALKEESIAPATRKKIELGYQNAQTLLTIANEILHINTTGINSGNVRAAIVDGLHSQTQSQRHQRKLSILCAEDFDTNQIIIRQIIEDMGHEITIVENGEQALETLVNQKFDVILMDRRMPKMDGNEASTHIRSGQWSGRIIEQKDIPIVALTANMTKADIDSYWAVGVNAIVGKPIDKAELFRVIENIIQQRQSSEQSCNDESVESRPEKIPQATESDLDAMFGLSAQENPPAKKSTVSGGGP